MAIYLHVKAASDFSGKGRFMKGPTRADLGDAEFSLANMPTNVGNMHIF